MGKLVSIQTGQQIPVSSGGNTGRGLVYTDGTPVALKTPETQKTSPASSGSAAGGKKAYTADPAIAQAATVRRQNRMKDTVTGAAKSSGAAFANLGGMLAEGAGKLNTLTANYNNAEADRNDREAVERYQNMLRDVKWADGKPMTAEDVKQVQGYLAAAKRRLAAREEHTDFVEKSDKAAADTAYRKADELQASSAQDVSRAKEGLGKVGQFVVDLGVAGTQMAGDIAVGALTGGSALPAMFLRSTGSAAQETRQSGASYNQQLAYGLGSGALSVATEKIANVAAPFQKAFGGGVLDKTISGAVAKMNGSAAGKLALSMLSEGGEEFIEDVFQPVLQRATYDPSARFDLSGALYDAAVGAALGGIGSGVEAAQNRRDTQGATQQAAGAHAEAAGDAYTPTAANAAESAQNAAPGVETAENIRVGQATTIKKPYKGEVPTQTQRQSTAPVQVSNDALTRAQNSIAGARGLESSLPGQSFKSTLKNVYKSIFKPAKGVIVDGTTFGGRPYAVDIPNSVPGKIISDTNLTAEKLALLDNLPDVVRNGTYVGSGEYIPHGSKTKKTVRFDYFEAPVEINGKQYIASFDVEAFPDVNNYRTHKLNEIELSSMANADTGRDPAANAMRTVPVEGTRPLNVDNSIAQGTENVKNGGSRDILSEVLFGKKRADMDVLTPEQQNAIYQANEAGTVGMDADGKVFQIDPEQHIDRRGAAEVADRSVNAFQFDHPELHRYYQEAAQTLLSELNGAVKGGDTHTATGEYGQTYAWRNRRMVSPRIAELLNSGMSYAETETALDAIVHDRGQENYANAKRVELVLDDMLTNGYQNGEQFVPANTAYLAEKDSIAGSRAESRGHGLDNVDAFDTPGDARAGAVNTEFDAMQAQSDEFHPVNPNSAQRIQTEQRRAPSEVPTVNPETGRSVEKTVSTILNSPLTSPEMASVYENAIAGGAFDYDVVTDRGAMQQAQRKIARDGWRETADAFVAKSDLGQRITKADIAEAVSAYNLAVEEGDHRAAFDLATAIAAAAHDSAQTVQAMNLMNRLTPEGRLLTLRRLVDRMNDRQAARRNARRRSSTSEADVETARENYIDRELGYTISDELATNYLMAETDAERAAAWDAITQSIADQIPSTFREKANFWRYTSMLANPTTHIRNLGGNALQLGARKIKNGIGTAIERAVIKDPSQRTKSILTPADKGLTEFAKAQYGADQTAAMGSGKYSDATAAGIEREIQSKRKMFQGEDVLSRAIQGIGDRNSRALDYEDVLFNKGAYVDSFAQALKAKGVTAAEAQAGTRAADVEAARAYAIEEAQRATYRNTTALSEALSQMGRYEGENRVLRAASFAADAFLPFRKTPANILTTGLDYSPVGLAKGVKEAMFDVKSGRCTAADAVDSLASGLTGTGILALGAYLAAEGLLHVKAGDDDKEEAFEKATGGQDYALQIGDKSYSLDWAVPAAMPLFAGAAIMESAQKNGGTFDAVVNAMLGMQDVVLETSMLSSLNDLASNISYAESKPLYLIDRAASSYAGQYIPTIGSKVASVFDDTARKSYVEKGKGQFSSDVNYFLQGAAKKVPGVRNQLQPVIDLWGNEVSNGTTPERVFQSFLSPGYLKTRDNSPAAQEVRRLAEATGETKVYPQAVDKSFAVNGETKYLTAEEYTKYAKTTGATRREIVEKLLKSKGYNKLTDSEKADAISYAYEYANVKGKQSVSSYTPKSGMVKSMLQSALPPETYILYTVNSDRDKNGSTDAVESARTLQELSVSDAVRGKAWVQKNPDSNEGKNPFTGTLPDAGISTDDSIGIMDKYRELYNRKDMKSKEKAAEFGRYVRSLGLNSQQMAAVRKVYTMWGSFPIEW